MGVAWSMPSNNRGRHHHNRRPNQQLLMHNGWTANDLLYEDVTSLREIMEDREMGQTLRTVAKFSPCQKSNCKCGTGIFSGVICDNFGWKNSKCDRPGCNHLLSDHVLNLVNASRLELTVLIRLIFDIINIKGTLENEYTKPRSERNIVLEEVYDSIYNVLSKCIRHNSFTAPNVDTIYGSPPFENTNIDQILLNFCMLMFNNDILEFKNTLIITKFILRYFDTWIWTTPEEKLNYNSSEFSNSYKYYYRRFWLYCCLPRCVHSITLRYKASKIFGRDVLKYTLKEFRIQLQVWCYKHNIMWTEHTKLFCLNYLPKYMDLLEKEVYKDKSPIWNKHYRLSDIQKKILSYQK